MMNEQKVEKTLLELGHRENLLGTAYIRMALPMWRQGMSITKELYPALAKAAGSTPSRVERAMRHSIATAWDRGNLDAQREYFGYTVSPVRGVPTVSEYVARMARVCGED